MSSSTPALSPAFRCARALIAVLALALLWNYVFAMTGLLWWNADAPGEAIARPDPPKLPTVQTEWVDVDAYLRTHPVWRP